MTETENIEFVNTGFIEFLEDNVQKRIKELPWMEERSFSYAKSMDEVSEFVDKAIEVKLCAHDLETTGLNTRFRIEGEKRVLYDSIVGFGLCYDPKFAIYIPIGHNEGSEYNLPKKLVLKEINRLCHNCVTLYHNAKFDLTFLRNYGIIVFDPDKFEDTLLLAYMYDSGRKNLQLKTLSSELLNQPMLKLSDVTVKNRFDLVSPAIGYVYCASDAMCTLDLYNYFINQNIVKEQQNIYKLEKRVVFPVMDMESNLIKIDVPYLKGLKDKIELHIKAIKDEIYALVGRDFNLGSPLQLGKVLFEELEYKYPEKDKTKTGLYSTDDNTLSKIQDLYPIIKKIMQFRGLEKVLSTYINNLLKNHDEDCYVKLNFKQTGTDTGRFSSPGGYGIEEDGCSKVNVQSTPKAPSEDFPEIDMRKSFIPREEKVFVAIDYAAEEYRIATNISRETTWINAINKGIDYHTATGAIISGKSPENVTKGERKIGKTVNFLALYGGGYTSLASTAKISIPEAKKILAAFFSGVPRLKRWVNQEVKKARKLKYVKTIFGRTRPLEKYYKTGDHKLMSHADRCAVNTQVQGCLVAKERCLTTGGYLPIIKIKQLKELGKDLKVWTGVSWEEFEVLERGEAQLAVIELNNGMSINCDTRHEVLTVNDEEYKFKKFDELTKDTKICVSCPKLMEYGNYPYDCVQELIIKTPEEWDFIAYFLGCVMGCGKISGRFIKFNLNKIRGIYYTLKYRLGKLRIVLSEPVFHQGTSIYTFSTKTEVIIELLEKLGYKNNERVPQKIMESPVSMRVAFLRGYLETCKLKGTQTSLITTNKVFLQDVQLLAWTLGCPSYIKPYVDDLYILYGDYGTILALIKLLLEEKMRETYEFENMLLPDFLRRPILKILGKENKNQYLAEFRGRKKINLRKVLEFLEDKKCDIPEIYYYSNLKCKKVLDEKDITYTLSVHSSRHQFDSAGIISKNTAADIMKLVMASLHSWFTRNNLHEDIKILITMHDELVFEMPRDKMELYVPEICKIMVLREVINNKLQWPVPLEVDVKYGDSWRVKNDFFEDFPETRKRLDEPLMEFLQKEKVKEEPPLKLVEIKDEKKELTGSEDTERVFETPDIEKGEQDVVEKDEKIEVEKVPVEEILSIDKNDQDLVFTVRELTAPTLRWLNGIIPFLIDDAEKRGNKDKKRFKTLKIRDQKGNSLLVSEYKINADYFLLFARYYGI